MELRRGYDEEETYCKKCGGPAWRKSVYLEQFISGETVPKGNATRAGNIKDPKGRYQLTLFKEASEEVAYAKKRGN